MKFLNINKDSFRFFIIFRDSWLLLWILSYVWAFHTTFIHIITYPFCWYKLNEWFYIFHREDLPKEEKITHKREDSIEYLVKQLESSASFMMKTPSKTFCKSPRTPLKTSSSQKPKMKPNSAYKSKISEMQSPVGMNLKTNSIIFIII